jgi:hypothetical protein
MPDHHLIIGFPFRCDLQQDLFKIGIWKSIGRERRSWLFSLDVSLNGGDSVSADRGYFIGKIKFFDRAAAVGLSCNFGGHELSLTLLDFDRICISCRAFRGMRQMTRPCPRVLLCQTSAPSGNYRSIFLIDSSIWGMYVVHSSKQHNAERSIRGEQVSVPARVRPLGPLSYQQSLFHHPAFAAALYGNGDPLALGGACPGEGRAPMNRGCASVTASDVGRAQPGTQEETGASTIQYSRPASF